MSKIYKKKKSARRRRNTKVHADRKTVHSRKRCGSPKNPIPGNGTGPSRYTFYSILNTGFKMDQGSAAASIARGLLALCYKLEADELKAERFDEWIHTGQKIVVLKGYNHKHLKYLRDEVRYTAVDTETLYRKWGRGRAILVLTVFGQEEDLEDTFQGLSFLR